MSKAKSRKPTLDQEARAIMADWDAKQKQRAESGSQTRIGKAVFRSRADGRLILI